MSDSRRKIVLLGAGDRYNYGDNLMPVLFRRFILSSHPKVASEFDIVCAAVRESDLSAYGCLPTKSIADLRSVPAGSLIIVFGGEVLCARSDALFMHVQGSRASYLMAALLRRLAPVVFSWWANISYPAPWEFPYIPSPRFFQNEVQVAFNAVGGEIPARVDAKTSAELLRRIDESSFFSSRDVRFNRSVGDTGREYLVRPDSASSMSEIVSKEERLEALRSVAPCLEYVSYVVVQAAPRKLSIPIDSLVGELRDLAKTVGVKVVLLPIGRASGHDDVRVLETIARKLGEDGILLGTLSLIEILAVISWSAGYVGTSLHGAITAQSFGKPHFCLGDKVPKLTAYLRQWSAAPFDTPVNHSNLAQVVGDALEDVAGTHAISTRARNNALSAIRGFREIIALIEYGVGNRAEGVQA